MSATIIKIAAMEHCPGRQETNKENEREGGKEGGGA